MNKKKSEDQCEERWHSTLAVRGKIYRICQLRYCLAYG